MTLLGVQFFNIMFRGQAPFVRSKPKVIKAVMGEIDMAKNEIFYELGSGDAGMLRQMSKLYPKNKFVGIEYATLPWLVSKIQIALNKSQVRIWKKNFFQADLSQADYLYCYLNIETMAKLEKKLQKQGKRGAVIISNTFAFPHWQPYKIMPTGKQQLFFYKINHR